MRDGHWGWNMSSIGNWGAWFLSVCSLQCVVFLSMLIRSIWRSDIWNINIIHAETLTVALIAAMMEQNNLVKSVCVNTVSCLVINGVSGFVWANSFGTGVFYLQVIGVHCVVLCLGMWLLGKIKNGIAESRWDFGRRHASAVLMLGTCMIVSCSVLFLWVSGIIESKA